MKKLFTIFLGLLLCNLGFAQNNENKENEFIIGSQLRTRAEYRNGTISPHADGADPAGFINNRARLTMDYNMMTSVFWEVWIGMYRDVLMTH